MCVFYYRDVSVRKDVVIKDVHASKSVLGEGLDVDVPTLRIFLILGHWQPNQTTMKWSGKSY